MLLGLHTECMLIVHGPIAEAAEPTSVPHGLGNVTADK